MTLSYEPIGPHMRPDVSKRTSSDVIASTMTKRECFAITILGGLLSDPNVFLTPATINYAVQGADLLIKALNGEDITPPKPVYEPSPDWPED